MSIESPQIDTTENRIESTEKTESRLQAQAEIFADKGTKEFSENQAKLFKYSAELSKITDLNNLPLDLPEELVDLIQKNKDAYLNFLRTERKLETSFIEENIKIYKDKFQSVILDLKSKVAQGNFKDLPEYLGSGANSSAFRIEVEGKNYAVKFPNYDMNSINFAIKPLLRAKGIPNTAQLESYSFEDNVVIMKLLPGNEVTNFTPKNAPEYTDGDIIQLINTVIELDAKGLTIDPKPSNFMYDQGDGFSILDYQLTSNSSTYRLPQEIISLWLALTKRKFEELDYMADNYKEKYLSQTIEKNRIFLPMMVRFLSILKEKYPNILSKWQQDQEEMKKDPRITLSKLIDRKYIPQHPDFEPYLKKLEEMGF